MPAEILIDGAWRAATASGTFRALNPETGIEIGDDYPISERADVEAAILAGSAAAEELLDVSGAARAEFLERYAERIEQRAAEIVEAAHAETALPANPRLADIELRRPSAGGRSVERAGDAFRSDS